MITDRILNDIKEGNISPVYFLYGPESFYRVEIVRALNKKLITLDNKGFNFENFEARETLVGDWLVAAKTMSFMGGIKLIIVRNLHEISLKDSDQKMLLDYIANPVTNCCLVITAEKVDRKRKIYKALSSIGGALLCEPPQEAGLAPWVKRRARSFGYELSTEAALRMVERVGAKPGILAKELEKIITYAGKSKKIAESMVRDLVWDIKMENAFSLTEALKEKKAQKALVLLKNQLDHGEDPAKILGLLAWQYRTIWEVKHYQSQKLKTNEIAIRMGAKPFLVEKALRFTKNFNRATLRNGIKYLFEADRELKTSGKNPQGILEGLVLMLCSR